ncbi:MAG: nitrile hydratase subunit beta [Pseudomonadota bacterium]
MDGPHDLGGKDGFGPIDVHASPFSHDWEQRQWALSKNVPIPGGTIDWWRHGIENMDPGTYLTIPYFEKWCLNELAHRIDQGMFSLDEVTSGKPNVVGEPAEPLSMDACLAQLRSNNTDFGREPSAAPRFACGDLVRTMSYPISGHSRLPAYARGKMGHVRAHHGAHANPTAGATGTDVATHLYTIEFTGTELWGPNAPESDRMCLDLFEDNIGPA